MHTINVFHQPSTRQVVLVSDTHASSYYVTELKEELGGLIQDHLGKTSHENFGIAMIPHSIITIDDDGEPEVSLVGAVKPPRLPNDNIPSDL